MIKHFLLLSSIAVTLLALPGYSFTFSSKIAVDRNGELKKTLTIECTAQDSLCQQTCEYSSRCEVSETICEDCATSSSAVLRTVFTELPQIYKSELLPIDQKQISQFLKSQRFMTISDDSFLNLFTPENKQELKSQFMHLCFVRNIQSVVLITTIDQQNHIDQLVGVLCQDELGQSVLLPTQYNSLFTDKKINYWSLPDQMPLNLKLIRELQ